MQKANTSLILYCLFIANFVFSETQLIEFTLMNSLLTLSRYAIITLLFMTFIEKFQYRINKKNIFVIILYVIALILNKVFFRGSAGLLLMSIVVVTIYYSKYDVEKIVKSTLRTMWACSIIIITLSLVGILEDRTGIRYVGSSFLRFYDGSNLRHTYGFLVANQIPLLFFVTYIYLIIIKRDKMKIYEHLIVFGANFALLFMFGSRNTFVFVFATMIAYFVARKLTDNRRVKRKKNKYAIFWLVYPVCFLLSLFASLKYDGTNHAWRTINNILMNRIIMSQTAIKTFGVSLFGSGERALDNLVVEGVRSSTLDNGYMNLLMTRGIIITVFIVCLWTYLTYRAEKERNFYLVFSLVALAGSNLIDAHMTSYKMIPLFVLMLNTYSNVLTMDRVNLLNMLQVGDVYEYDRRVN